MHAHAQTPTYEAVIHVIILVFFQGRRQGSNASRRFGKLGEY